MRLLLDSHAFVWAAVGDRRLSPVAERHFVDPANQVFLSAATVWELAIKQSLGKLRLPETLARAVDRCLSANRVGWLGIEPAHCTAVEALPFHHRDPFDRMLVAQAQHEGLAILSADPALDAYGVARIW